MTIKDLNDQLQIKQLQLQLAIDTDTKQRIQNQIQVLQFKKEIETIKAKIQQLESR